MKLIDKRNRNDKVPVKRLKLGTVFCWDDRIYVKCDNQNPYQVTAMDLVSFQVIEFKPSTEANIVYAELVINDTVKE